MTEKPPATFRRPSDPSGPLPPLRGGEQLNKVHGEWARLHPAEEASLDLGPRLRQRARAATMRIAAGGHGELLADLIRAIDAIAARCDELSGRVEKLEVVADDLARVLGEEVTHLRAAVERMETQGSGFTTP